MLLLGWGPGYAIKTSQCCKGTDAVTVCAAEVSMGARWLEKTLWTTPGPNIPNVVPDFPRSNQLQGMEGSGVMMSWELGDCDAYFGFHPLLIV